MGFQRQHFACDIPFPPSANRIWRTTVVGGRQRTYPAPEYKKWIKHADALLLSRKGPGWDLPVIKGVFVARLSLSEKLWTSSGDGDNRVKATLDWAQHAGLIENDKFCKQGCFWWTELQEGTEARLALWKYHGTHSQVPLECGSPGED